MRLGKGPIAFPHCLIMSTIGCTDSGYEDYAYNSLQSAHTSVFRLAGLGLVVFGPTVSSHAIYSSLADPFNCLERQLEPQHEGSLILSSMVGPNVLYCALFAGRSRH